MASPEPISTGCPICINGHHIEPESQIEGGELYKSTASKSNYVLIQFNGFPNPEQESQLRDIGVQFCCVIHPNSWLARFDPSDLSPLRQLPFVIYANPYHERFSLHPNFEAVLLDERRPHGLAGPGPSSAAPKLHNVFIMLHPGSRSSEGMRDYLVSDHSIPRDRVRPETQQALNANLTASEILRISKMDDVSSIEKVPVSQFLNHLTRFDINIPTAENIAKGVRYYWPIGEPTTEAFELNGQDEIICIADSGLDLGEKTNPFMHDFFDKRIYKLDPRSVSRPGDCTDRTSHGTHVAGIALGSYDKMVVQPDIQLYFPSFRGVAPKAQLIMQAVSSEPIFDGDDKFVSNKTLDIGKDEYALERLFLDPYYGYPDRFLRPTTAKSVPGSPRIPDGAIQHPDCKVRIHNNSWGIPPTVSIADGDPLGYNGYSEALDEIVLTVPDLCLIFAAGNSGDNAKLTDAFPLDTTNNPLGEGQIHSIAAAKNVITVGACYNGQYIRTKHDTPATNPASTDPPTTPGTAPGTNPAATPGSNPATTSPEAKKERLYASYTKGGERIECCHMPRFSSRGPTICAPGETPAAQQDIIKPDIVAPGVAIYSSKSRYETLESDNEKAPKPSDDWEFQSGTSMAAPVVAGAVALLRQALKKRGVDWPSAALIKALLVNGAVDLSKENGTVMPGNTKELNGCGYTLPVPIEEAPSDAQGFGRLDIADSIENILNTKICGFNDACPPKLPTDPAGPLRFGLNPPDRKSYPVQIWPPSFHPRLPWKEGAPRPKAHIKATVAYTDLPKKGIQHRLALSIRFRDPTIANLKNKRIDANSTDPRLKRMAKNNVQKLIVTDIDMWNGGLPIELDVVVTAVAIQRRITLSGDEELPLSFAVCWKYWYA